MFYVFTFVPEQKVYKSFLLHVYHPNCVKLYTGQSRFRVRFSYHYYVYVYA